jgi:hypothetical protein
MTNAYTLITSQGKIEQFAVRAAAELYQQIWGGVIVTADILVDPKSQTVYNSETQ